MLKTDLQNTLKTDLDSAISRKIRAAGREPKYQLHQALPKNTTKIRTLGGIDFSVLNQTLKIPLCRKNVSQLGLQNFQEKIYTSQTFVYANFPTSPIN